MQTNDLPSIETMSAAHNLPSGRLCHNTRVLRGANNVAVVFHETEIVRFTRAGIRLNSGGWQTTTTKQRIDALLPRCWRLFAKDRTWYVQNVLDGAGAIDWNAHEPREFSDGMLLAWPAKVRAGGAA